jgi:hypothetical protein
MHVRAGRDPGADVEELPDARLSSKDRGPPANDAELLGY